METKVLNYRIIVTPEKFKGRTVYNALCPTLGVADWGESIDLAIRHIKGAIKCYIEGLIEEHQPVPIPDELDVTITTTSIKLPLGFKPNFA